MITDSIDCEFDAKPSNNPGGTVWFGTVIDGEIEEHQITPDAAETLAAELIEAARQARGYLTAHRAPVVHALWPRGRAVIACDGKDRRDDDGLDESGGYANTTCPRCIERLIADAVTLADPTATLRHVGGRS